MCSHCSSYSHLEIMTERIVSPTASFEIAWAITVHKSQGLTIDQAVIDIGEKDFCTGLSFVALSRIRKLQDCLIKQFILTG